jgi:periplasmic divalent cation tolerance protein
LDYTAKARKAAVKYHIVYITAADEVEARKIGRTLVAENVAACVNIHPIQSIYRWRGKVEEGTEVALMVKTTDNMVDRVIERAQELHSYQVPDIVAWPIAKGNPDYLKWIAESVKEV